MRTLRLLVDDWKGMSWQLFAQGPQRLTRTRRLLNVTCALAILWTILMATHFNVKVTLIVTAAFAMALTAMCTLLGMSAGCNWRMTKLRAISGLGYALVFLLGVELVCTGLSADQWQWPWVLIGVLFAGASINPGISKLQASLTRVRNLDCL